VPHTTLRSAGGRKGPVHDVRHAPQRGRPHRGQAAVRLLTEQRYCWRLERRRCRRSQTVPSRRMEHTPPNCGSQHAKIAFAYTRRYQSDAGRLETQWFRLLH